MKLGNRFELMQNYSWKVGLCGLRSLEGNGECVESGKETIPDVPDGDITQSSSESFRSSSEE